MKGQLRNSKYETRNPKQILNSKSECLKQWENQTFRILDIRISDLFRVSKFGFRIFLFFLAASCGGSLVDEGENFGNLLNTASGLVLTQAEHPTGWGHSECTLCHNLENIHLVDRTGVTNIQSVHDRAIREGITGCAACHGTNGSP